MPILNRSRARQWSHTAWAIAAVFGSMPVAGRLLLGSWGFEGALELACGLTLLGTYFHILGRRPYRTAPDPATVLDRAIRLAADGKVEEAIHTLTETIRVNPRLWQAYQYRGELHLTLDRPGAALSDFETAIALAGAEPHLCVLRDRARDESAAAGPAD